MRAAGPAAAGRREGRVASQSRRTPAAHRPPCLRGLLRQLPGARAGASPTSAAPAARGSAPAPPVPRLRGLPAPPVLDTSRQAPLGFRPPGQRPQSPASSTADGQGAGAHGPAPRGPKRSGAPRARPVTSPGHPLASPPACARERPLAPAPHLRRASAPSAPPGPAVYTGSDVSGPAPPPPQADAGVAADPGPRSRPPSREPGGGGPELPTPGDEDLPVVQLGRGLRTGVQSPQGHPHPPLWLGPRASGVSCVLTYLLLK